MNHAAQIWETIAYIEAHLTSPLSLADLAHRAAFSPYHFHRIFLAVVGEPVMDYIRQRRLTMAASDLVHSPDRRILDIAVEYQFNSQEVFTRAFQKAYGVSPGSYRKRKTFQPLRNRADSDLQSATPPRSEGPAAVTKTLFERVHATFLVVRDLESSVRWYTEKLGLEVMSHWSTGADLKVYNDETMLTLIQVPDCQPVHFMDFKAWDLTAARDLLRSRGVAVSEITEGGPVRTFQFSDPDGNSFGVWWTRDAAPAQAAPTQLFDRIDRVFMPVRDLDGAVDWYQRVLGLTLLHHWNEGADFRVATGESLFTLVRQEAMQPRGLVHELAEAPCFNFKVSNIRRCHRWLRTKGARVTEIMQNPYIMCFNLWDPEGNLIGVCFEKPSSPYYTR